MTGLERGDPSSVSYGGLRQAQAGNFQCLWDKSKDKKEVRHAFNTESGGRFHSGLRTGQTPWPRSICQGR